MRNSTSRKLSMAAKVRDLAKAKALATQLYVDALTRLDAGIDRAKGLDSEQRSGRNTSRAASIQKEQHREEIWEGYLRPMARIADAASATEPGLADRFRLPVKKCSSRKFVTLTRTVIREAGSRVPLFVSYGMPETLLADLTEKFAAYEATTEQQNAGTATRVAANRALEEVMKEIMGQIQQLDAMQRYRLRDNPADLAAWESARNVAWPEQPAVKAAKQEPAA